MSNWTVPDKFDPAKSYTGMQWGEQSKVLEVELSELQKILKTSLQTLVSSLCMDGFLNRNPLTYSAGVLTVPADTLFLGGSIAQLLEPMTLSVASGTVYLAYWEQTVAYGDTVKKSGNQSGGSTITNGIMDTRLNVETSRRTQLQVQLMTTNVDGTKQYINVASISSGVVTDLRPRADVLGSNQNTRKTLTIPHGQSIFNNVDRSSILRLSTLKGRTLTNLLGRLGNMEATGKNTIVNLSEAADTTNFTNGVQSLKYTATGATSLEHYSIIGASAGSGGSALIQANKYYLILGAVRPNVGQANLRSITFDSANTSLADSVANTSPITDTTKFTNKYIKFQAGSTATKLEIRGQILSATGAITYIPAATPENASFDAIRLYEVDSVTYNKIGDGVTTGYQTADDLDKLFPYVDDVKHLSNAAVTVYGKNLLSPFTSAKYLVTASNAHVLEPYKLYIQSGGNGDFTSLEFPCAPNTSYTLSSILTNAYQAIFTTDLVTSIQAYTTNGTFTFNSGNNTTLTYEVKSVSTASDSYVDKPMLNIGSTALPFEPQNNDVKYIPTTLASSTDGTVYDTLTYRDGSLRKNKRWMTDFVLDGSLAWAFTNDYNGFKAVKAPVSNEVADSEKITKYDGKILQHVYPPTTSDQSYMSGDWVYLTIADTDSGWGETYTPTVGEIQAYFAGWKMYDNVNQSNTYSTGTKAWVERYNFGVAGTGTTDFNYVKSLTNQGYNAWNATYSPALNLYKPFNYHRLAYQLATEQEEVIPTEWLSVHDGFNQIELTEGVIVREVPNIDVVPSQGYAYINAYDNVNPSLYKLKYRTNKIIRVYKNGVPDGKWTFIIITEATATPVRGSTYAQILLADYDPTAEYTVTYVALDKYAITCNAVSADFQYATNLKTVVDDSVQSIADMSQRLVATEREIQLLHNPKNDMIPWIAPTLQSGWVNTAIGDEGIAGYYKDSSGIVRFKGLIKGGTVTAETIICTLPVGYRPRENKYIATTSNTAFAYLKVDPSGNLRVRTASAIDLSLDTIQFRAEL